MRNSTHAQILTLTFLLVVGVCFCGPVSADMGNGFASSAGLNLKGDGLTYSLQRPGGGMQAKVGACPEADVQRYVITKGQNGGSAVRIELAPAKERAGLSEMPVLAVDNDLAIEILRLTNLARAEHGLGPVTADRALAIAAEGHSTEMVTLNYFSHTSPTPGLGTPMERVSLAGAQASRISENLFQAEGYPEEGLAQVVVDSWLSSPGHRANLLDPQVTRVGLGVVEKNGKVSVTQVFAGSYR